MFNPTQFYEFGKQRKTFESTWKTDNTSAGSSTSTQVRLPLISAGTYAMNVNWGDGTSSTITAWNVGNTHTYSVAGTYTIKITGTCIGWQFNNTGDRLKLLSITTWGGLRLGNIGYYFYGCANLNLSTVEDILDLTGTTSLLNAFANCTSLTTVGRMNEWNTSNVINMQGMFSTCNNFNQPIGNWNTANVTNMGNMFLSCSVFNQNIGSWNVSNVTNMSTMFLGCSVFNQNIGSWNVSNVTNMSTMFRVARLFNNGGSNTINNWNVSKVTNMNNMFSHNGAGGAATFNQNIGSWDVSSVTDMSSMFFVQGSFNNGGSNTINNWNVSNVTNMSLMFSSTPFNQNIGSWNVGNVLNMTSMFALCPFNQNIGSWDVSKVTSMANMFQQNFAFNQNIGSWNVSNVTNMSLMFQQAYAFNQNIGSWNVSNVTNFTNFMQHKSAANFSTTNLDAIYNGWSALVGGVKPSITISFGTAKYTAGASAGKLILTSAPNNWTITDGGI